LPLQKEKRINGKELVHEGLKIHGEKSGLLIGMTSVLLAPKKNMFSGATAISGGDLRPIWLYTVECCRSVVCSTHFSWEDEDPLENHQPTEWPCLDTNSYPRYDGERDIIGMVLLIINPH
jgi:hypothetical protein